MNLRRPTGPVAYLAAQGVTLGLLGGFIIIPASGIFLERYGSSGLPWVYIAVALVGAAITPGMASALRRWSLATVCVPVLSIITALITAIWVGLDATDAVWMSFPLQVLFQVVLQLGFTFIGGQAGMLLTVRQMKEQFPRIVTGFAVGFMASGLLGPVLLSVLGRTERLLAVASLCSGALLALVSLTRRRFPAQLSVMQRSADDAPAVPLRTLLLRPFVFLLLSYQVLSMFGTQLIDFLVYDRAAARYATSAELARFTSVFTVALNAADIVFLALVAAWMLRRYGMRLGLVANPLVATMFVLGGLLSGTASGMGALSVFMAFAGARVADIVLTDGSTRTAINTAYQALPAHERLAVQAGVEGLGIPGAIGVAGIALLVLEHGFEADARAVAGLTVVAGVLWALSGLAVYRGYQRNLRANLSRRVLRPADIDLEAVVDSDPSVQTAAHRLLGDAGRSRSKIVDPMPDGGVRDLLRADDPDVRTSAYHSAAALAAHDPEMLQLVLDGLGTASTASMAAAALVTQHGGFGDLLDQALTNTEGSTKQCLRLVRCAARSSDPAVVGVLRRHVGHRSRDIGLEVLSSLVRLVAQHGPGPGPDQWSRLVGDVLRDDLVHAQRCDRAMAALARVAGAGELVRSLQDERNLLRRRTLAALGLVVDPATVVQARAWLEGTDQRAAALALEALEVSVPKQMRAAAVQLLQGSPGTAPMTGSATASATADTLVDLAGDPQGIWRRDWLGECAQHAILAGR